MTKSLILIFALALLPTAAFARTPEPVMCSDLYKPVCAAQPVECFAAPCYPVYKTYPNSCNAAAGGATVIHEGECAADESGPVKPLPESTPLPTYVPPAGCTAWNDGCNSCAKNGNGAICTQMACVGPTHPGYCTQYAASAPHEATNPSTTVTMPASTIVANSSSATAATTPLHLGFFARLWHAFLSWF